MLINPPTKVLLVDDEPAILAALTYLTKKAGYEVVTATDGDAALALIKNGWQPDLAVLDVMMPGISGFELATELRKQTALEKLNIVFLTARGSQTDKQTGYRSGAEVYLTKPFDNQTLLDVLADLATFG